LNVFVDDDTVWLNQEQISFLFDRERSVITKHIRNVFREGELDEKSNVQKMHIPNSDKPVSFFNLDVIISVGYRVKSKRGTQFRIWANKVLRDYLMKGYSLNQKLLSDKKDKLINLQYAIGIINNLKKSNELTDDETSSLIDVLSRYSKALDVLDDYDHQKLAINPGKAKEIYKLSLKDSQKVIQLLRNKFPSSELFGKEKDKSFRSSISTIYQTFDGKELYSGIELKAANLLYFLVKNHSFIDGNKRIAAAIFLWFMNKNNLLFDELCRKRIDDFALIGLTLMIAESNPKDKEQIISVVMNLLSL
jgi:prophage maintenance system killer protein